MLRRHVPTILVAMVTAAVTAAAPSIAAAFDALNADKVDGKHAVGAKASLTKRKGKLVATNKKGKLPNNIINKAAAANVADLAVQAEDADELDGLSSTSFMKGVNAAYYSSTGTVVVGGAEINLLTTVPGLRAVASCPAGNADAGVRIDAGDWNEGYTELNGAVEAFFDFGPGGFLNGDPADPGHWTFALAHRSGTILGGTRTVVIEVWGMEQGSGTCAFLARATDRSTGGFPLI